MTAPVHRIWAVVPFRGPVGSKRRLSGLLAPSERERLSLAMLTDVLDVLLASTSIERVLLLTSSVDDVSWPRHPRLSVVAEPGPEDGTVEIDGLNGALRHAQQLAQDGGAGGVLIVPADLPLLAPSDLTAILAAGKSASIVIAPDRAGIGTNALLLAPPSTIPASFGEESFHRHRALAENADRSVAVLNRAGFGLDLDTPADVAELLHRPPAAPAGRAATVLRDLGVEERLAQAVPAQARSTTI